MRVLHVYSGNLFGGIESFLCTLARHDGVGSLWSEFALSHEGRLADELRGLGARLHDLGETQLRRPWTVLSASKRLRRVLREKNFDAVVCHAPWSHALFGPTVRDSGVPLVFWQHDAASGGYEWTERGAARCVPDFVICNSAFTQSTLAKLYRAVPSVVCHYPVELSPTRLAPEERAAIRADFGATDRTVVIIQTSRMQAWKGQRRHLRALAQIRDLPAWISVQVGGPQRPAEFTYFAELQSMVRELGIQERVTFLGQRADVPRLLAAADIHCQPNEGPEPFGIAFIEALTAGLPVVTMDFGGAREIVTPEVGFLAADESGLAQALRLLIADPERRASMARAAPSRARSMCEPATQMEAIARALSAALSKGPIARASG